jgi:hypothetical protein
MESSWKHIGDVVHTFGHPSQTSLWAAFTLAIGERLGHLRRMLSTII